MKISRSALLFLAAITASAGCTPTVSSDPVVNGGETAAGEEANPEGSVDVAVGSVVLESDCPDSPVIDPSVPASTVVPPAPAKRAKPRPPGAAAPADAPVAGAVPSRRRCQQSTLQLTFENHGAASAKVGIVEVRLHDVLTEQLVATLPSRMPSKWSEADNAYGAWDQNLAASSSARTSYRIKPPSWPAVEAKLDGKLSRGRTYNVEVSVEINGLPASARSAEFTRPPIMPMPPT